MRLTVIGCGHLGATHAACMAELGHEVLGVDIDPDKVALLNAGRAWFLEPDLDELLALHTKSGRLRFTTSFAEAAEFGTVHFLGVGTPGLPGQLRVRPVPGFRRRRRPRPAPDPARAHRRQVHRPARHHGPADPRTPRQRPRR